jgi:hypothetical protein
MNESQYLNYISCGNISFKAKLGNDYVAHYTVARQSAQNSHQETATTYTVRSLLLLLQYVVLQTYEHVPEKHKQTSHKIHRSLTCFYKEHMGHSPVPILVILSINGVNFAFVLIDFEDTLCCCLLLTLDLVARTKSSSSEDELMSSL